MKFDRHIGSIAAEVSVKFQSDRTILNSNLAASRLYEILRKDVFSDIETGPSPLVRIPNIRTNYDFTYISCRIFVYNREWYLSGHYWNYQMVLTGAVKSKQLIWRSGTHRFHLLVPNRQMNCGGLTMIVSNMAVVTTMALWTKLLIFFYVNRAHLGCCLTKLYTRKRKLFCLINHFWLKYLIMYDVI